MGFFLFFFMFRDSSNVLHDWIFLEGGLFFARGENSQGESIRGQIKRERYLKGQKPAPKEVMMEEECSRSALLFSYATWSKSWSPSAGEMVQGLHHVS